MRHRHFLLEEPGELQLVVKLLLSSEIPQLHASIYITLVSFGGASGAAALVRVPLCCLSAPPLLGGLRPIPFGFGVICDSFLPPLTFLFGRE